MVIKIKVSNVAADFGKTNKDIIGILSNYCEGKKTANTVLEENELNIIFEKLTQDNSVKSFDEYFKSAKPAEKKAPKKEAPKKKENKKLEEEEPAPIANPESFDMKDVDEYEAEKSKGRKISKRLGK